MAGVLVFAGVAGAESGSGKGTITAPLQVGVGNVCAYMPSEFDHSDLNGANFTQTNNGDSSRPILSGSYYATKDLSGAATLRIRCTKGTQVKRSFPAQVLLLKDGRGGGDYLSVNVSERFTLLGSSGHLVPDVHQSAMTFKIPAGQWGASKGNYLGNFVMTYEYK